MSIEPDSKIIKIGGNGRGKWQKLRLQKLGEKLLHQNTGSQPVYYIGMNKV